MMRWSALVVWLMGWLAHAQGQTSTLETALSMPPGRELVVVASDAAQLRQSPVGRTMVDLLSSVGAFASTVDAFDKLAETLGADGPTAFDLVFGQRFVFIADGLTEAQEPVWVIATRVSATTAKRFRTALQASPREVRGGRPWLTLERGRFELVVIEDAAPTSGATVVLGPTSAEGLFRALVARFSGEAPEHVLGLTGAGDTLRLAGDGSVVVVYSPAGQIAGEPARNAAFAASPVGARLRVRAALAPASVWAPEIDAGAIPLRPAPEISLGERTLASMVLAPSADPARRGLLSSLPGVPIDAAMRLVLGVVSDRVALTLEELPWPNEHEVALGVAAEVRDPQKAALAGDSILAGTLGLPDFRGIAPEAERRGACNARLADEFAPWLASDVATWRMLPPNSKRGSLVHGRADLVAQEVAPGEQSLWILRMTGVAADAPSPERLLAPRAGEARRRLTTGAARPGAFAQLQRAHGLQPPPLLERFQRVDWDVWLDEGLIVSEVLVEAAGTPTRAR